MCVATVSEKLTFHTHWPPLSLFSTYLLIARQLDKKIWTSYCCAAHTLFIFSFSLSSVHLPLAHPPSNTYIHKTNTFYVPVKLAKNFADRPRIWSVSNWHNVRNNLVTLSVQQIWILFSVYLRLQNILWNRLRILIFECLNSIVVWTVPVFYSIFHIPYQPWHVKAVFFHLQSLVSSFI